MKPFQHYVPVRLDLADLKARYDWAEASQDRAQEISAKGKELAKHIFSPAYMASLYDDLFVDYAGKVVESYVASNATWEESHQRYIERGFELTKVAYCRVEKCFTNVRDDVYRAFPHGIANLEHSPSMQSDDVNKQEDTELERSLPSVPQSPQYISSETQEVNTALTLGSPEIPSAALVLESPEIPPAALVRASPEAPPSPSGSSTETVMVSTEMVAVSPVIPEAPLLLEGSEGPDSSTEAPVVRAALVDKSPEIPAAALVVESPEVPQSPTGSSTETVVVSADSVAETPQVPDTALVVESPEVPQSPPESSIETQKVNPSLVAVSPEVPEAALVPEGPEFPYLHSDISIETQEVNQTLVAESRETLQWPHPDSSMNAHQMAKPALVAESSDACTLYQVLVLGVVVLGYGLT